MADEFILYHLGSLPTFAQLTRSQLEQVANTVELQRYEIGSIVFAFGEATKGMYKFVSGQAELWQPVDGGQPRLLATIGSNQYINETALIRQSTESATLRVVQPAHVLMISRDMLIDVLVQHPDIQNGIPLKIEMPMVSPRYNYRPRPQFRDAPDSFAPQPDTPLNVPRSPRMPDRVPNAAFDAQAQPTPSGEQPKTKLFRSQRDDEVILLHTHRHWWAYMRKAWFPFIIFVAMLWMSSLIDNVAITIAINGLALIVPGSIMLYFYLDWRNDQLIVTNYRVLHIERTIRTLKTSISEVPIHSIQEINADDIVENDPFSRLVGYGKIALNTPGDAGNIIFKVVAHPQKIQQIVIENRTHHQKQQASQHLAQIQADVDRAVGRKHVPQAQPEKPKNSPKIGNVQTWLGWTKQLGDKGEVIYRKHPLFWWRLTWFPMMMTVISAGFFIGSGLFWDVLGVVDTFLALLAVIFFAVWTYFADWDWRNDMYIIGDETIQLIHKRPFWLQNENDQVYLERIDNVVSEKGGVLQNLLNYGHVRLLLVGADKNDAKVFKYVANPQEVQAEVTKHQEQLRRKKQDTQAQQRRKEFTEYLSVYHQTTGVEQPQNIPKGIPAVPDSDLPPKSSTGEPHDTNPQGRNRMRPPNIPRS